MPTTKSAASRYTTDALPRRPGTSVNTDRNNPAQRRRVSPSNRRRLQGKPRVQSRNLHHVVNRPGCKTNSSTDSIEVLSY